MKSSKEKRNLENEPDRNLGKESSISHIKNSAWSRQENISGPTDRPGAIEHAGDLKTIKPELERVQ